MFGLPPTVSPKMMNKIKGNVIKLNVQLSENMHMIHKYDNAWALRNQIIKVTLDN